MCKGPAKEDIAPSAIGWQQWRERDGMWVASSFVPPGNYCDPPSFDPHTGEMLSCPVFPRGVYGTTPQPTPVDVVIPLGRGSRVNNEELRYALRSLAAHFEDLGRVWIVGEKPRWLKPNERLIHLPVANICPISDVSIIHKVRTACIGAPRLPRLSEKFVFCCDDHILLRPLSYRQLGPYHCGDLDGKHDWQGEWWLRLLFTREWLLSKGKKALHCDSHVPIPMDRNAFIRMTKESPWRDSPGLCIGTLYLNWTGAEMVPIGQRASYAVAGTSAEKLRAMVAGRWFLTHTEGGFTPEVQRLLAELFPDPTPWEADVSPRVVPSRPTLSIVVPTLGKACLEGTLKTIRDQRLVDGDQVIVVQDGADDENTQRVFAQSGLPGLCVATGKAAHDFGATPRNLGMRLATANYLCFSDDDDVYLPGAFDAIRRRAAEHPRRPLMFRNRVSAWNGRIRWEDKTIRPHNVGTPMFVVPNEPDKLGRWPSNRGADYGFIHRTMELWGRESIVWCPEVLQDYLDPHSSGPRPMTRNLLYHIYPLAENDEWRLNVEYLLRYWHVFNGRKLVGIVIDENTVSAAEVQAAFGGRDIEWLIARNDPQLGEVVTFRVGIEKLRSLNTDEATFYAHAKGVKNLCGQWRMRDDRSRANMVSSVRNWRNRMYTYCLGANETNLDRILRRRSAAGCFRIPGDVGTLHKSRSDNPCYWFFAGTFFWLNHLAYFGNPQPVPLRDNRWGVEYHLGSLFPIEDTHNFLEYPARFNGKFYGLSDKEWAEVGPLKDEPLTWNDLEAAWAVAANAK